MRSLPHIKSNYISGPIGSRNCLGLGIGCCRGLRISLHINGIVEKTRYNDGRFDLGPPKCVGSGFPRSASEQNRQIMDTQSRIVSIKDIREVSIGEFYTSKLSLKIAMFKVFRLTISCLTSTFSASFHGADSVMLTALTAVVNDLQ